MVGQREIAVVEIVREVLGADVEAGKVVERTRRVRCLRRRRRGGRRQQRKQPRSRRTSTARFIAGPPHRRRHVRPRLTSLRASASLIAPLRTRRTSSPRNVDDRRFDSHRRRPVVHCEIGVRQRVLNDAGVGAAARCSWRWSPPAGRTVLISPRTAHVSGTRKPTVSPPAVTHRPTKPSRRTIRVSGPGKKAWATRRANALPGAYSSNSATLPK